MSVRKEVVEEVPDLPNDMALEEPEPEAEEINFAPNYVPTRGFNHLGEPRRRVMKSQHGWVSLSQGDKT